MKLSLNWLNDFIKHGLSPEALAERLTMAGHEVKAIESIGGDHVFEIEITPNRPDCLNVRGIAREVSAIVGKPLKDAKAVRPKIPAKKCDVTIADRAGCRRYIGAIIENVSVKDSPSSVSDRLKAIGLRPISNIVDITNHFLFELGQPMHAFDYDKLIGGKIIVRRAKAGEKIVTIDGVERELNPEILVIADAKRPVAIAGVMGGAATEVTVSTKRVLLESAYFDPILVRRAGRALGLSSDSSYRFERGVDPRNVGLAAQKALSAIVDLAGGEVTHYRDIDFLKKNKPKKFSISSEALSSFLGTRVPAVRIKNILELLAFRVTIKGKTLSVTPPDFRGDIKGDVDLAEEIARIIGYDRLSASLPQVKPSTIPTSESFQLQRRLRGLLVGQGLDEVISYPLVSRTAIERCRISPESAIRVKNPLSLDQEFLRPSLLPSMLAVAALNYNRGQKDLRIFEFGKVYENAGEEAAVAMILTGSSTKEDWRSTVRAAFDFYDLKGVVERIIAGAGIRVFEVVPSQNELFAPGLAADIVCYKTVIGRIGRVHQAIVKSWDLKPEDIYYAEIGLKHFSLKQADEKFFAHLPLFPSMTRDISLAVPDDVPFSRINALVLQNGGSLLTAVRFRELYRGDKIPAGQKGVVLSLVYQSPERTLTEADIAPAHEKIIQRLVQDLPAVVR